VSPAGNEERRVRLRVHHGGIPQWLCRVEADGAIRLTQNTNHAILLARDAARAQARSLRANDPNTAVEIVAFNGVVLEEVQPPLEGAPVDNRVPVYDDTTFIRIIPGAGGQWYLRFPNSPHESIRGASPEEVLDKFQSHPWHLELEKFAERYVPSAEEPVDPRELQRQFEREQTNGRRTRPGDQKW
jgi:hypothetical protein